MDDPIHQQNSLLPSEPPDIMNDPAYAPPPPQRRDTASTIGGETCRICRSEGTPDEPLFYPCKCSGSIKFVHQECLMEWLSHSHKKYCELCKTPFRFTKLYDANMPQSLPWHVFLTRACLHLVTMFVRGCRALVVAGVWLLLLPWMVRWTWRWMFWFADAGWARESYMRKMQEAHVRQTSNKTIITGALNSTHELRLTGTLIGAMEQFWDKQFGSAATGGTLHGKTMEMVKDALSSAFKNATTAPNDTNTTFYWPQSDVSILSSWTYISDMTSSKQINRAVLDVFEGQLITCVVIVGFILVFLIREWVVQQQPLVNLNGNNAQREREERDREHERVQRQAELLLQASRRLVELQQEAQDAQHASNSTEEADGTEFRGVAVVELLVESATQHLRTFLNNNDETGYDNFVARAGLVMAQIRAAEGAGTSISNLADKVYEKLATYTSEERQAWEEILVSELKVKGSSEARSSFTADQPLFGTSVASESRASATPPPRPQMPHRDASSRATRIQRLFEETDNALALHERHTAGAPPPSSTDAEPPTDDGSVVSAPSNQGSWSLVSPPQQNARQASEYSETFQDDNDEIPITNAGPDAKINIKRKGNARAIVPEPQADEAKLITTEELKKRLEVGTTSPEPNVQPSNLDAAEGQALEQADAGVLNQNPFHTDGAEPERVDEPAYAPIPGSPESDHAGRVLTDAEGEVHSTDDSGPILGLVAQPIANPDPVQRLTDWFWGDIQAPAAPEPVPAPNEELLVGQADEQEAAFVPVEDGLPQVGEAHPEQAVNDPEVAAAAAQAGLNAEAIEDAEDLEGVFELIGLQGPLIGLFQTSCFCSVLVTGSVFGAVGLPYVWGKLVLSFLGAPATFLVKTPLQVASFVADLIIDTTLLLSSWTAVLGALLFSFAESWWPAIAQYNIAAWVNHKASSAAGSAATRLTNMFISRGEPAMSDGMGWNWAFLQASVHAHSSLKTIQGEVNAVLNCTGNSISSTLDALSTGSSSIIWQKLRAAASSTVEVPTRFQAGVEALEQYIQPIFEVAAKLKRGALTFNYENAPMDPTLVYWNNADRGVAIFTGYAALAVIAAIYVAIDKPITSSQSGKKTEKILRDTLRQAGGVLKVILIISIEMLVFPLYCGMLLDIAFLPLFQGDSAATRWAWALRSPYLFCFVHWFLGTCYMFHFALFVGMCRKILRKGVLWFIRDPDDPTFHPVRDVLERNVTTQLRKIAFSALVYGALVILCLGGVIFSIGRVFEGIFPVRWVATEPLLEFPVDLFLYMFITPMLIRHLQLSRVISTMYGWWLRRCAKALRLSHFLFDDRQKDEEGRHIRKSWADVLSMKKATFTEAAKSSSRQDSASIEESDVSFVRDGKYVLTPCNDSYRPPKPGEAFLHVEDSDVYIADKDGKKNNHFSAIYVPPLFRLRISLFMVCLWVFTAFLGLCVTLLPLTFGRQIFSALLPSGVQINDLYAYSVGIYILGGAVFAGCKGPSVITSLRVRFASVSTAAWVASAKQYCLRALKCAYLYGFVYLSPLLAALVLHFYLVLPLHTYMDGSFGAMLEAATNATQGAAYPSQGPVESVDPNQKSVVLPKLTHHGVHIVSDYALCMLYLRIAARMLLSPPGSRAAEAYRRVVADGYLNPDIRLATRYFIFPALLLATFLIATPLAIAQAFISMMTTFHIVLNESLRTYLYRYSYPLAASCVLLVVGTTEIARATSRWRARIRDEVYLVGERLHNFGEKKPPAGSRSVVRKDK